jgi:transcription-repair coupling factor (superfamily II helicase)
MAFASVVRAIEKSPLTKELVAKLDKNRTLLLNGLPRLPKGIVTSGLARKVEKNLLVICPTLEEAGRWATQLEAMGWQTVNFYPTSEASPYDPFDPESETIWGQMQVLSGIDAAKNNTVIVTTEKALQPHLPPPEVFQSYCLSLETGMSFASGELDRNLARLGYDRVSLVETEGQWSRRGDIVDIFPVSAELPVRLEWFGDELEQIKEFDASTQRSLDKLDRVLLTPTSFATIIINTIRELGKDLNDYLSEEELAEFAEGKIPEGMQRFLGLAFPNPANILDYLPANTLMAIDEIEQCQVHNDRWLGRSQEQWKGIISQGKSTVKLPKIHHSLEDILFNIDKFQPLYLSEIAEENPHLTIGDPERVSVINLYSRPIPTTPHQFGKLAAILRGKK